MKFLYYFHDTVHQAVLVFVVRCNGQSVLISHLHIPTLSCLLISILSQVYSTIGARQRYLDSSVMTVSRFRDTYAHRAEQVKHTVLYCLWTMADLTDGWPAAVGSSHFVGIFVRNKHVSRSSYVDSLIRAALCLNIQIMFIKPSSHIICQVFFVPVAHPSGVF